MALLNYRRRQRKLRKRPRAVSFVVNNETPFLSTNSVRSGQNVPNDGDSTNFSANPNPSAEMSQHSGTFLPGSILSSSNPYMSINNQGNTNFNGNNFHSRQSDLSTPSTFDSQQNLLHNSYQPQHEYNPFRAQGGLSSASQTHPVSYMNSLASASDRGSGSPGHQLLRNSIHVGSLNNASNGLGIDFGAGEISTSRQLTSDPAGRADEFAIPPPGYSALTFTSNNNSLVTDVPLVASSVPTNTEQQRQLHEMQRSTSPTSITSLTNPHSIYVPMPSAPVSAVSSPTSSDGRDASVVTTTYPADLKSKIASSSAEGAIAQSSQGSSTGQRQETLHNEMVAHQKGLEQQLNRVYETQNGSGSQADLPTYSKS